MTTSITPVNAEDELKTSSGSVEHAQLSPVGDLISQSWLRLKAHFGTFAALFFIEMFVFIAIFVIAAIIGIAGGVGAGLSSGNLQNLLKGPNAAQFLATAGVLVFILVLVVVVISMMIAVVFQGAMIAIAASGTDPLRMGEAIKMGRSKVGPLLVAGFVSGLLVFGGFFFFLIPGLIFAILFSMSMYAVMLENYSGVEALRVSAGLVKNHFWEVLGRIGLLVALNIGISLVLGVILETVGKIIGESGASLLGMVLNIVVNIGMMGFSIIYMTLLYQQLKAARNIKPMSLKGIAVVAVLGLLISGLFIVGIVSAARLAAQKFPAGMNNSVTSPSDSNAGGTDYNNDQITDEQWKAIFQKAMEESTASAKPTTSTQSPSDDTTTNFSY